MSTTDNKPAEVFDAEDAFNAYMREHYGPMWGHENNDEAAKLQARLLALYEKHGIPEWDRIAL